MSGHSKWATIKHAKAATDARRGQLFTKLTREIIVAARQGGGNPETNFRLRMAIQRAKDNNLPMDNIERAIKKATGALSEQDRLEEVRYEGYGPGGAAIILQALTDNRNRTASEVRSTFAKSGGSLAEVGAVAWQFEQRGMIIVEADQDRRDELALLAIDAGADDFDASDSVLEVYVAPDKLEQVRKALAEHNASIRTAEISLVPKTTVLLDEKSALQTLRLLDRLEELDDIQKVYFNADFPDEVVHQYRGESQ